jgi:hypothetical protein
MRARVRVLRGGCPVIAALLLLGALLFGPVNHVVQTRKIARIDREIEENNRRMRVRGER